MIILINILLTKTNYGNYFSYILNNIVLEKELKEIINCISEMYEHFSSAESFTIDEIQMYFYTNRSIREKDKPAYDALFQQSRGLSVSEEILQSVLSSLSQKAAAGELAMAAMAVAEGQRPVDDLRPLYEKLDTVSIESSSNFVNDDLEVLYSETVSNPGLRWRLNALNRSLGSLRRGDFGFIFARPETGKTTFLASEITFFASQTDRPILWFN